MSSSPPPVPRELKPISPYLARAHELATADPVIAYWCTYFAVQQAMTLGAKEPESQAFLFSIMDRLEAMKAEHGENDAVTDDVAASAYIENFGLKIFATADNEDRKGKATRATARKFLAAANFLELLSVFGDSSTENREKIKYSKWKATDLAKAFREGRTPAPGPAGGLPDTEDPGVGLNQVTAAEEKELTKEFEALVSTRDAAPPVEGENAEDDTNRDASYPFPQHPTTLPSVPSPSAPPASVEERRDEKAEEEEDPSRIHTPSLPTFIAEETTLAPDGVALLVEGDEAAESEDARATTDAVALAPASHQTARLATPGLHVPSEPPAFPSAVFPPSPSVPHPPAHPPVLTAVAPAAARNEPVRPSFSLDSTTTQTPTTMDPLEVAQVQKHARWAISALNYEDFETARTELRRALNMLGG